VELVWRDALWAPVSGRRLTAQRATPTDAPASGTSSTSQSVADLSEIERTLGYRFHNPALLERAFLHSSAAQRGDRGNERLEFLGDRVLGLIVAHALIRHFPGEPEGSLAKRHAVLVSRDTLAQIAVVIDLGRRLILAKGEEETGTRSNATVLADAMEALIAALYLDGGLDVARGFVEAHWWPLMTATLAPPQDPKTRLQEWALGNGLPLPAYHVVDQHGPDHDPVFDVSVRAMAPPPDVGGPSASPNAKPLNGC
jgi:ribonuclease III